MSDYHPTTDARQAMRAFLQRAEVRLSTMHRIAGVFLNGAGLLILFPVFFRDAISDTNGIVLIKIEILYDSILNNTLNPTILLDLILYVLLFVPFLLTLAIPLYAFYLLLKDIVYFYFANQSPGFDSNVQQPRFILSGLAFSPDESPETKRDVMRHQYSPELIEFILPFEQKTAQFYDHVYNQTNGLIQPATRRIETLREQEIFSSPNGEPQAAEFQRFNTALGLAGFLDRDLVEEVARAEISVVRYALCLRRLVLRYIKALLMFVWTTLVSFVLVSFLKTIQPLLILSVGYTVWAIGTPMVVQLPSTWIWQSINTTIKLNHVTRDEELSKFERHVRQLCAVSLAIALLTFIVECVRLWS